MSKFGAIIPLGLALVIAGWIGSAGFTSPVERAIAADDCQKDIDGCGTVVTWPRRLPESGSSHVDIVKRFGVPPQPHLPRSTDVRPIELSFMFGKDSARAIKSQSVALVVGVGDYIDKRWPRLSNALTDSEEVAAALRQHGFYSVLQQNPTVKEFASSLDHIMREFGRSADARILIFFAGHGYRAGNDDFLAFADSSNDAAVSAAATVDAFPISRLSTMMREAKALQVLALIDSCWPTKPKGAFVRGPEPPPQPTKTWTGDVLLPARQIIISDPLKPGLDSGSSPFARLFLSALTTKTSGPSGSSDSVLTGSELAAYLSEKSAAWHELGATPTLLVVDKNHFRGEFTFQRPVSADRDGIVRALRTISTTLPDK